MSRIGAAAFLAMAIGLLAGCATRPPLEELTNSILVAANNDPTVDLTNEQAACIARSLLDSDLSDTTLAGLAEDFDAPEVLAAEADEVEPTVAQAAERCLV